MFKFLSMAMLAVCFFAFQGKAVDGVGLVIPYKVECVKQSDGTKVIQVSACLRTTQKGVVVDGFVSSDYDSDDPSIGFNTSETTILQSKDACATLDAMVKVDGKLYGYPAQKISGDETYTFKFPAPHQDLEKTADVCVYFVDVTGCACKGDDKSFAKDHLRVEDNDTLAWVSLKYTGSEIDAFDSPSVYSTDQLLVSENFDDQDAALTVESYLVRLAMQKLHGTACCFPSFGMDDESVNALTLQIIEKMQACPQDFKATGTWGSCGDTANVKVNGTMTKPIIINVCGKKLCFTSLDRETQFGTLNSSQYFLWQFTQLVLQLLDRRVAIYKCGFQSEICQFVNGKTIQINDSELFIQIRLMCIDKESNTYGFALIQSGHNSGTDFAFFNDLGVRFKLEDCPKCCK